MYKLILLLIAVGLSSCMSKNGNPALIGNWKSETNDSPDLGEFIYKYRFFDNGLYELHVVPVGENGAFVTWGEYELLGKDTIKTKSKYIGGIVDGKVVERDEFNFNVDLKEHPTTRRAILSSLLNFLSFRPCVQRWMQLGRSSLTGYYQRVEEMEK